MNFVLTLDYELYGDGTGSVFSHIIEPTNNILDICNKNNIKVTIFVEAIEYLKIKNEWNKGNTMGYSKDPVKAIEEQLINAALNGHDIQLHIHPQWVNAIFENGKWKVDLSNWRLGDFNSDGNYDIEALITDAKEEVEELISEVIPNYKCIAFRAGAFNIMPSHQVFEAMRATGLKVDSSVYPGGYENGELSRYDYRNVPLELDFWWGSKEDITRPSDNTREIMELPVFALQQRRLKKVINTQKIKSFLFNKNNAVSSVARSNMAAKSTLEKIKFLFEKDAFTWDFCLFSQSQHKAYFNYIEKHLYDKRNSFVIIGHPKSFKNEKSLKSLIELSRKRKYSYSFKTLRELYEEFNN